MKSSEHRAVGEAATAGALVEVGGESAEDRFTLGYGDVVALSGDFFAGHCSASHGVVGNPIEPDGLTSDGLFQLAAIPGEWGTKPGTRDEIICALKVMAVDGAFVDARFEPEGEFHQHRFTATAATTKVERRVRDRFLALAMANGDHFVAPGGPGNTHDGTGPQLSCFGSAVRAYRRLHEVALDEACRLGRCRGDQSRAMAREAAAQHYLTDAFAAGHLRTPVTAIRQFWDQRYPRFWENLQCKVAADTSSALRKLVALTRTVPDDLLYHRVLAAVKARTAGWPPVTLGDLLARVFHDWDNSHGLALKGGGSLFGDGLLEEGAGKELAVAAVRAGIDDLQVAYRLGLSGSRLRGEALYQAVRSATGAAHHAFRPEMMIPTASAGNSPQNWWARDVRALWRSPIVGTTGTTVGMAVEETLSLGAEVSRRLDCLGPGVFEVPGLLSLPPVRRWAARKACQAYHHGFIQALAHDPKAMVFDIVDSVHVDSRRHSRRSKMQASDKDREHLGGHQPQVGEARRTSDSCVD